MSKLPYAIQISQAVLLLSNTSDKRKRNESGGIEQYLDKAEGKIMDIDYFKKKLRITQYNQASNTLERSWSYLRPTGLRYMKTTREFYIAKTNISCFQT